jgi:hypothetical protein
VSLVAGEIERKTIFPTLAKPLSRGQVGSTAGPRPRLHRRIVERP